MEEKSIYKAIPELKFLSIDNKVYFNASSFCEDNKIDKSVVIEYLSKVAPRLHSTLKIKKDIDPGDLAKKAGEVIHLIKDLTFDFVNYVSPDMLFYHSGVLNTYHRVGVTYSAPYIAEMASRNLSKEALLALAKTKNG